jgi:hypothetical protein
MGLTLFRSPNLGRNCVRAIFISYRRTDAPGEAGRLSDDLMAHFGAQSVFMDVSGIEPGRDFRTTIDESVSGCSVLLAVIGPDWLDANDKSGNRRLDDQSDFVRIEIASALKRSIPVIPVLVRGAATPLADQLTTDLSELAFRHAVELTHARWKSDVQALIQTLKPYAGSSASAASSATPLRRYFIPAIAVLITAAFAILLMQRFLHRGQSPDRSTISHPETTNSISTSPPQPKGDTQQGFPKPEVHSATTDQKDPKSLIPSQTSVLPSATLDKVTIIHSRDFSENTFMVDGKPASHFIVASTLNSTILQLPAGPHVLTTTIGGKQCTKRLNAPSNEPVILGCSVSDGGNPE